jgi:(R,R)-butanediol dehydrogenase/meso-butanediol dehydrogenase/diacetyl reductase
MKSTGRGIYYEGSGRFSVRAAPAVPPASGEVRIDVAYCGICGTDIHIAHGGMDHRVRVPQVIGHEMSGTIAQVGPGVEDIEVGDRVVVRPLDARGETPADKGFSHISRNLKFLGIDTPGAFQTSWTVPAFTIHSLPDGVDLRLAALTEPLAVACHDVWRAEVTPDDAVVVIGAGPIGLLIALVARGEGARVVLSEINPERLELARELGFDTIGASTDTASAAVAAITSGGGADVVFEVSGSPAGAMVMTELASLRGRIVVVAIYPEPQPVNLFDIFWKELQLRGARVYEPEDFQRAIELLAADVLPLERLVSAVEPLERLPAVLAELAAGASGIKTLVDCSA